MDGGSTDGTKDYLKTLHEEVRTRCVTPVVAMDEDGRIVRESQPAYGREGREIIILSFQRDIGATRTYNQGLRRATGEYCTYIVGDDIPHPHMIEELASALESSGADFVYSDMHVVDDQGRIIRERRMPDYSFESCFARWYHLGVSHLYRTEWHRKVGLMDEAMRRDLDYIFVTSIYYYPEIRGALLSKGLRERDDLCLICFAHQEIGQI